MRDALVESRERARARSNPPRIAAHDLPWVNHGEACRSVVLSYTQTRAPTSTPSAEISINHATAFASVSSASWPLLCRSSRRVLSLLRLSPSASSLHRSQTLWEKRSKREALGKAAVSRVTRGGYRFEKFGEIDVLYEEASWNAICNSYVPQGSPRMLYIRIMRKVFRITWRDFDNSSIRFFVIFVTMLHERTDESRTKEAIFCSTCSKGKFIQDLTLVDWLTNSVTGNAFMSLSSTGSHFQSISAVDWIERIVNFINVESVATLFN